ncbi:hypothetical protein BDR26DRAFT_881226, partial [Obelidium mucronatum]
MANRSHCFQDERKSNKPGFAFTAFEPFCPIHAQKDSEKPTARLSMSLASNEPLARIKASSLKRSSSVSVAGSGSSSAAAAGATKHPPSPPSSPAQMSRIPSIHKRSSMTAISRVTPPSPASSLAGSPNSSPRRATVRTSLPVPHRVLQKTSSVSTLEFNEDPARENPAAEVRQSNKPAKSKSRDFLSQYIPPPQATQGQPASSDAIEITPPSSNSDSSRIAASEEGFDPVHDGSLDTEATITQNDGSADFDDKNESSSNDQILEATITQYVEPPSSDDKGDPATVMESQDEIDILDAYENERDASDDSNFANTADPDAFEDEEQQEQYDFGFDDSRSTATGYDFQLDASSTHLSGPPSPTEHISTPSGRQLLSRHVSQHRPRRQRKPIDMTNLTLLHHLLTTRLADLQTHHAALIQTRRRSYTPLSASSSSPSSTSSSHYHLQSHHSQAYLTSAKEIVFLGRGIAKSWGPVARNCKDAHLGRELVLSLQKVDTLSARMKGVLGSVSRFLKDQDVVGGGSGVNFQKVDEEGIVLSSAIEVVKAAEEALGSLEAARLMVWEKDDEVNNEDSKALDSNSPNAVAPSAETISPFVVEGANGKSPIVFSGMEGMEEALRIAMDAAGAVG